MSNAFEITNDDVENVLSRNNVKSNTILVKSIFDILDHGLIEKAALYGDDIEEQTEYAYKEIESQLKILNIV